MLVKCEPLRCKSICTGGAERAALSTTPGIRIVHVREVGSVRIAVAPVDDIAVVRDIDIEERSEEVLFGIGPVPALPAVSASRVDELSRPGGVAQVLLTRQVHVNGVTGGSRLGDGQHHSDTERRCRHSCGQLLLDRHFSPGLSIRWSFQPF